MHRLFDALSVIISMNGPSSILFDVNGIPLTTLSDGSLLVTVADGYVTANFPAVQNVSVENFPAFPAVQDVTVNNFPATQPISGSVTASVSNFPATQPVSGTVSVSNFPATQPVSGSVTVTGTTTVTGAVTVSNFPATQAVSGSVTAAVSGTVAISNLPATQAVSQSGSWSVTTNKASTSSVAAVASATSSVVLLAANANRVFAHISNALPNKTLYVKLGAAASLASFTDAVLAGNAYDIPNDYTGVVTGIWAAGVNAANALITELTP